MSALPLIVFDVNETLLDLQTMEPVFQRIFGEQAAMRLWFANFIMYSAALTVAGCYVAFPNFGSGVMKMLADTHGINCRCPELASFRPLMPSVLAECPALLNSRVSMNGRQRKASPEGLQRRSRSIE